MSKQIECEKFLKKYKPPFGVVFNKEALKFEQRKGLICDYSHAIDKWNLMLEVWMNAKVSDVFQIEWLGSCNECGNSALDVTSEEGNDQLLYADDHVKCPECGEEGVIDADGENAWVCWG